MVIDERLEFVYELFQCGSNLKPLYCNIHIEILHLHCCELISTIPLKIFTLYSFNLPNSQRYVPRCNKSFHHPWNMVQY
jgi:hypothetical protein